MEPDADADDGAAEVFTPVYPKAFDPTDPAGTRKLLQVKLQTAQGVAAAMNPQPMEPPVPQPQEPTSYSQQILEMAQAGSLDARKALQDHWKELDGQRKTAEKGVSDARGAYAQQLGAMQGRAPTEVAAPESTWGDAVLALAGLFGGQTNQVGRYQAQGRAYRQQQAEEVAKRADLAQKEKDKMLLDALSQEWKHAEDAYGDAVGAVDKFQAESVRGESDRANKMFDMAGDAYRAEVADQGRRDIAEIKAKVDQMEEAGRNARNAASNAAKERIATANNKAKATLEDKKFSHTKTLLDIKEKGLKARQDERIKAAEKALGKRIKASERENIAEGERKNWEAENDAIATMIDTYGKQIAETQKEIDALGKLLASGEEAEGANMDGLKATVTRLQTLRSKAVAKLNERVAERNKANPQAPLSPLPGVMK